MKYNQITKFMGVLRTIIFFMINQPVKEKNDKRKKLLKRRF